jgi:hypothetical protein
VENPLDTVGTDSILLFEQIMQQRACLHPLSEGRISSKNRRIRGGLGRYLIRNETVE